MGSLVFNANTENVSIAGASPINNVEAKTIMMWYRAVSRSSSVTYLGIDKIKTAGEGWLLYCPAFGVGPWNWRFVQQRVTTQASVETTGGVISVNRWEWICVAEDAGVAPWMLHGTLSARATVKAQTPITGAGAVIDDVTAPLTFGHSPRFGQTFNGEIAHVAYYNRMMSQAEALRHQYEPYPASGCVHFSYIGHDGTSVVTDLSGNRTNGSVTGATLSSGLPLRQRIFVPESQIWTPAAGGGLIRHPGMAGGMQQLHGGMAA